MSKMSRLSAALLLVVVLAVTTVPALSQTSNGRIEGVVQDSTGAVVPNATATLINVRTDAKLQFTTDATGAFLFAALPAGVYNLSVEAGGFRKAVVNNIELTVGATIAQPISLEVGATSESVQVEANAVSVQTTESQIARATTMKEIDTLPQLGRTPITLAALNGPGIQINAGDPSFSRVNGLRQGANNSKLDGIDVNDSVVPRLGLSMTANNTDSIGEFRIVTGGGKAEYGRSAGAQVELITRSGTNDWHGNLFEYLRNTELNANDFFNNSSRVSRPKFIQNIYGGSVGTKVLRDKWFIFGNFQGRRTSTDTIRNRTVYTPEAKSGIFRWNSGGTVQTFNVLAADPLGKGLDPTVAKLLARLPAPNNADIGDGLNTQGFRFNSPSGSKEDQYTIKSDYNVTPTNRAFFRWSWQRNSSFDALNSADATYPGEPVGTQGGHRWGFSAGDDWTIRPNLINEFRLGYQRSDVAFLRPGRPAGTAVFLNTISNPDFNGNAQGRWAPVVDITENLTWLRGKHTFKMGGNIRRTLQHGWDEAGIYPSVTTAVANGVTVPTSVGPAGLASTDRTRFEQLFNNLLGRVDQVTQTFYSDLQTFQTGPRVRDHVLSEAGYFFQDDWRVTRKLTLNLGLRWEYFLKPNEQNGLQGYFDKAGLMNGATPVTDASVVKGNNWFKTDWNNFAPRFGFAYDLKGDGKTAIRGNYGIFYDRTMGSVVSAIDGATPAFAQSVPVLSSGEVRVSDGTLKLPSVPGSPQVKPDLSRGISIYLPNPELRTGYVENFGLNIQREVLRNTVLEVGYVGNRGVKLYLNRDINQPRIYEDFLGAFKELQAFQANSTALPSANNTIVKLYGTPQAAVTGLGATTVSQGLVGTAVNTFDRVNWSRYAAAGIPATYLRLYPQFNQVRFGTNDGRSYYDSLQVSLRRSAGAFRSSINYTFGKAIDNVGAYSATSSAPEGNGFAVPIDSFNLRLMRGIADFDRKHVFNMSGIYTLPFGRGKRWGSSWNKVVDSLAGGWDLGGFWIWQSGAPYTVLSQRVTAGYNGQNTWANYSGERGTVGSVDRRGNGVFFLPATELAKFSFPGAGELGNQGRNQFYGPRFFDVDLSLVKRFKVTETAAFAFRAEAYNLFNNTNFGGLTLNINDAATFGKFSSTNGLQAGSARTMQMALRFDF